MDGSRHRHGARRTDRRRLRTGAERGPDGRLAPGDADDVLPGHDGAARRDNGPDDPVRGVALDHPVRAQDLQDLRPVREQPPDHDSGHHRRGGDRAECRPEVHPDGHLRAGHRRQRGREPPGRGTDQPRRYRCVRPLRAALGAVRRGPRSPDRPRRRRLARGVPASVDGLGAGRLRQLEPRPGRSGGGGRGGKHAPIGRLGFPEPGCPGDVRVCGHFRRRHRREQGPATAGQGRTGGGHLMAVNRGGNGRVAVADRASGGPSGAARRRPGALGGVQNRTVLAYAVAAAVAVGWSVIAPNYWIFTVTSGIILGIAGLGLLAIVGWGREISLMQAGLTGTAAYLTGYFYRSTEGGWGLPFLAAVGLAIL